MIAENTKSFLKNQHVKLLRRCMYVLPGAYGSLDSSRPTVLSFSISGLCLMNEFPDMSPKKRQQIVDWIYSLQIGREHHVLPEAYGFRGASYSDPNTSDSIEHISDYETAHIAQTFSALCCLLILGDDLERVDREAVLTAVAACQQEDGSFSACGKRAENDMSFVFCAITICYILHDFTTINVDAVCQFIRNCFNYDGGFGQMPKMESHGGSTYCAVASLSLLSRLWDESVLTRQQIEHLKRWAILKQTEGFHGRTNKPDDTCYAFWIGATLLMLNALHLVDNKQLRSFLFSKQDPQHGGFSKNSDTNADILHTYFGIAALAVFNEPDIMPLYPALNLPMPAFEHLTRLHRNRR